MDTALSIFSVMPQARTAIRYYLRLQKGENLAIIWDETVSAEFAQAVRIAAQEVQAEVAFVTYEPLAYRPLKEYCWFAGRSLKEPLVIPPVLDACLHSADAIFFLISDMEIMFSPSMRELSNLGKRVLIVFYHDTPSIKRLLFDNLRDVEEIRRKVEYYGDLFENGRYAHVTSAEGTDLTVSLGQWEVRRRTGIPKSGVFQVLPPGQITRVPDDKSANGTLVIDRTIAANDYKVLHEPIVLRVKNGNVVDIEGGLEAKNLAVFLESLNDERAYHVTELSMGTNPLCKFSGLCAPTEDTHKRGTVSFALGCDTHIGGGTPAPVHIDMTMSFPSLEIDGKQIIQGGKLVEEI
jgi:leucyl aminopeptidase (aminopeptidase T)